MAGDQEDAINLVVHNLTHGDSASASSQSLLQSGRRLVDVASQNGRWYQPSRNFNTTIFKKSRNSFTFYLTAPSYRVDGCSYNALKKDDIKEWGADLIPPNESEIFSLAELEDFSSTNLDRLLPVSQGATSRQPALPLINSDLIRHARSSKVHTEATEEETNKEHNKKRRRLDACSLYRLIPQPHFYAVPFAIPTLSSIGPVDFFSKSSPKPITPHTSETIDKYLNDRYARAAWIIPVRGTLPWYNCSSASILVMGSGGEVAAPHLVLPTALSGELAPPITNTRSEIVWTNSSLTAFWNFLFLLRKACNLGSISLSFHAAPVSDIVSSSKEAFPPGHNDSYASSGSPIDASDGLERSARCTLLSVDHIKVYHETRFTRHVRNAVHAWAYEWNCIPSAASSKRAEQVLKADEGTMIERETRITGIRSDDGNLPVEIRRKKIRLFKGARLVLVDGRSKGVLTC